MLMRLLPEEEQVLGFGASFLLMLLMLLSSEYTAAPLLSATGDNTSSLVSHRDSIAKCQHDLLEANALEVSASVGPFMWCR